MKKRFPYQPDFAVPPGETLQETIDALGIGLAEFALRAELSGETLHAILQGNEPITEDIAQRFEKETGIPVHFWLNLETNYRERLSQLRAKPRLVQEP